MGNEGCVFPVLAGVEGNLSNWTHAKTVFLAFAGLKDGNEKNLVLHSVFPVLAWLK